LSTYLASCLSRPRLRITWDHVEEVKRVVKYPVDVQLKSSFFKLYVPPEKIPMWIPMSFGYRAAVFTGANNEFARALRERLKELGMEEISFSLRINLGKGPYGPAGMGKLKVTPPLLSQRVCAEIVRAVGSVCPGGEEFASSVECANCGALINAVAELRKTVNLSEIELVDASEVVEGATVLYKAKSHGVYITWVWKSERGATRNNIRVAIDKNRVSFIYTGFPELLLPTLWLIARASEP